MCQGDDIRCNGSVWAWLLLENPFNVRLGYTLSIFEIPVVKSSLAISGCPNVRYFHLPINDQCSHHKETSELVCRANLLIGFYIMGTLVVQVLNNLRVIVLILFSLIPWKSKYITLYEILSLPVPIPAEEKKIKLNFYFHTSLWCLKRFYKPFLFVPDWDGKG